MRLAMRLWWRNLLPVVHRGWAERWHVARWIHDDESFVHNPWTAGRWRYEYVLCRTCGEMRTKVQAAMGGGA